jgi:hypothetical protein
MDLWDEDQGSDGQCCKEVVQRHCLFKDPSQIGGGSEKHLIDNSTDMLFQSPSEVKWVPYNKFHVGNYDKVHYDNISVMLWFYWWYSRAIHSPVQV